MSQRIPVHCVRAAGRFGLYLLTLGTYHWLPTIADVRYQHRQTPSIKHRLPRSKVLPSHR